MECGRKVSVVGRSMRKNLNIARNLGYDAAQFTTAQLKTIQEVITLVVFSVFSVTYLGERLRWNYLAGFGCMVLAVFFVFKKW